MEPQKLQQALNIKREIQFCEDEVSEMKRLREYMLKIQDDKDPGERMCAIEKAWKEFHMYDFSNCWAVELREKFTKAILETIDERLAFLDRDLIELNKEFDKL